MAEGGEVTKWGAKKLFALDAEGVGYVGCGGGSVHVVGERVVVIGGATRGLVVNKGGVEVKCGGLRLLGGKDAPSLSGHSGVVLDGSVYTFGGVRMRGEGEMQFLDDLWQLYPSADGSLQWRKLEVEGDAPSARTGHTFVSMGKYALLFGGANEDGPRNDIYAFYPPTSPTHHSCKWERIEAKGMGEGKGEGGGGMGESGGGEGGGGEKDATTRSPGFFPCGREMHAGFCLGGGKMGVFGGRDGGGAVLGDAWVLEVKEKDDGTLEGKWMEGSGVEKDVGIVAAAVCVKETSAEELGGKGEGDEGTDALFPLDVFLIGGLVFSTTTPSPPSLSPHPFCIRIPSHSPSSWTLSPLPTSPSIAPRFSAAGTWLPGVGALAAGGMGIDKDFASLILLHPTPCPAIPTWLTEEEKG